MQENETDNKKVGEIGETGKRDGVRSSNTSGQHRLHCKKNT